MACFALTFVFTTYTPEIAVRKLVYYTVMLTLPNACSLFFLGGVGMPTVVQNPGISQLGAED